MMENSTRMVPNFMAKHEFVNYSIVCPNQQPPEFLNKIEYE